MRRLAALFFALPLAAQTDLGRILPINQPIHVAVIGDFGSGDHHQAEVAEALRRRNSQTPFQMGLTVGDNFYRCGVRSISDRKWTTPQGIIDQEWETREVQPIEQVRKAALAAHPEWSETEVGREVARRLSHGAV